MSYPTEPKKVLIRDRFLEVLEDLAGLEDCFYPPGEVLAKPTNWQTRQAEVNYDVYFVGTEEGPEHLAGHMITETFIVAVVGGLRVSDGDLQRALARGLQDVRRAIFADRASGEAGSLQALCLGLTLGPWTMKPGSDQAPGIGAFEQHFIVKASGRIEDL